MHARNVAWLLPLFLTACLHLHKPQQQQNQVLAPPNDNLPKPPLTHPELSASTVTIPDEPLATDSDVKQEPIPPAKHKKPAKTTQQAASANSQQAVSAPPVVPESPGPGASASASVSAIGELSSGGDPSDQRRETDETIASTERGLNGLGRSLNDQEQKTAAQIREYIKQAREALLSGDMDGAKTLAAKAKALLTELSQ
jgi:hypothetical protein